MQTDYVFFGSSRISYSHLGTGNKLLLCLHGYGESAASFALLEEALGKEFTILAPDLPFHGDTRWNDGLYFDPAKFPALIEKIIDALPVAAGLQIPLFDRWWVLGYSMGGRIALSLLENAPQKIAQLILLAPDGFKMNPWYWLATQSLPGNRVFRKLMRQPRYLFLLFRIAGKLKLLNPSIHKFMFRYIDDPQVREELYNRWTVMRGFRPDIRSIRSIIRKRMIPVSLLYGRHDRVIRAATGERFRKGIEPWCDIHTLDTGHALLQPKYLDRIITLLKD